MDADFNLRYNFEQHLENSNEDPPENDLEILESLFAEEMTVEEVTEVVLQDACASVSTRDAEREMQQTFSREREENFCAPQLKRFKIVSDEELQEFKERRHSLSTLKATKWGVKTFQEWSLETYGEMLDFNNINPEEHANKLGKFYAEATPKPVLARSGDPNLKF
nr:uncharacterized protein LOC117685963 [Crassostrea gigas]